MDENNKIKNHDGKIPQRKNNKLLKTIVGAIAATTAAVANTPDEVRADCRGCTGCLGCGGACTDCAGKCGGCTGACRTDCNTGCKTSCGTTCSMDGCSSCTGKCNTTCTTTCGSNGCSSSCGTDGCSTSCNTGCNGCVASCKSDCAGCTGQCQGCTSCNGCSGCGYGCAFSCSGCNGGCNASVYASYTITLDNQGATTAGTAKLNDVQSGSNMPTIAIPAKKGYAFEGYFSEPNGGGTQYYDDKGLSVKPWDNINDISGYGGSYGSHATSTATLYAKWRLLTYNINYITHGGKFNNDVISHSETNSSGSLKGRSKKVAQYNVHSENIIIENPTRKGMIFKGWKKKEY